MCTIYGLFDPRDGQLKYIGKTVRDLQTRLKGHLSNSALKSTTRKNSWIKKLKTLNLKPHIKEIEIVEESLQDEREVYWIGFFKKQNIDLLNGTDGGTGGATRTGRKNSPEHIYKLQEGLKKARKEGRFFNVLWTEERKRKISNLRKGMKFTDEHKKNLSLVKTGLKLNLTDEQILAKSLRFKSKKRPPEFGQTISKSKKGIYTEAMKKQIAHLHELQKTLSPDERRKGTAKLNTEDVRKIKQLLSVGGSLNKIARLFDVSKRTILFIKQGKTWKDVIV